MDGNLTYGPKGRLISVLAIIGATVATLESSGVLTHLPEKYKWIAAVVTITGLIIAGVSERIQGGASNPEVRIAAQQSDNKNALERTNAGG
jgi:hypothetical protein